MNWYNHINEIAQNLAQGLADNPEMEFEAQEAISSLPRHLQQIVWNRINFYIKQYLEQGGGVVEFFAFKNSKSLDSQSELPPDLRNL